MHLQQVPGDGKPAAIRAPGQSPHPGIERERRDAHSLLPVQHHHIRAVVRGEHRRSRTDRDVMERTDFRKECNLPPRLQLEHRHAVLRREDRPHDEPSIRAEATAARQTARLVDVMTEDGPALLPIPHRQRATPVAHRQIPAVRAEFHQRRAFLLLGNLPFRHAQARDFLPIIHRADDDVAIGQAQGAETKFPIKPVGGHRRLSGQLRLDAKIRQRQRGHCFVAQFGGRRNRRRAPDDIERCRPATERFVLPDRADIGEIGAPQFRPCIGLRLLRPLLVPLRPQAGKCRDGRERHDCEERERHRRVRPQQAALRSGALPRNISGRRSGWAFVRHGGRLAETGRHRHWKAARALGDCRYPIHDAPNVCWCGGCRHTSIGLHASFGLPLSFLPCP